MVRDPWDAFVRQAAALKAEAEAATGLTAEISFERPDAPFGDLAYPCFAYAKAARKAPPAIAAEMASRITAGGLVAAITASGPYVNFTADAGALARELFAAWRELGKAYGSGEPRTARVLVEHTSVNPTGPIHVGRARNPIIGDALARLLRLAGNPVATEYLVNDVGRQMVLLAWGVKHLAVSDVPAAEREKEDYRLVRYYQAANARLESDPALEGEIQQLIFRLENGDETLVREVRAVGERILAGIRETLERLGVTFDRYFWESDLLLGGRIKPAVDRLLAVPGAAVEDGGHFIDLASFGVHGRDTKWFFLRKDGTSLYPTRDVAYHLDKLSRCDEAIVVLGEDQRLANAQLRAALNLLGTGRDVEPVFYAYVSLPEGKMSTREGRVVYMDDLLDEAVARAYLEVAKRRPDLSEERKRAIADLVGVGAVRYHIVRVQAEKAITFVWEEALSFEGSAAPYLQYAHARCHGILSKAGTFDVPADLPPMEPAERALVLTLARYPGTVAAAAAGRRPHRVATYADELANAFTAFYHACPVLDAAEPARAFRLTLVVLTKAVLASALDVLGVIAPDEM